jgi:hypothetical protein
MHNLVVFSGNRSKIMISNLFFIDVYGNSDGSPLCPQENTILHINSTVELSTFFYQIYKFILAVMFIHIALNCGKANHPEFQNICCAFKYIMCSLSTEL